MGIFLGRIREKGGLLREREEESRHARRKEREFIQLEMEDISGGRVRSAGSIDVPGRAGLIGDMGYCMYAECLYRYV